MQPAFIAQVIVTERLVRRPADGDARARARRSIAATSAFTAGNCANGAPATAGLLTHPGVHAHFFSNLAFRRVRWVQETFACTKFPAEIATTADRRRRRAPYTGVFPFESIAGSDDGGRVDFHDTSA